MAGRPMTRHDLDPLDLILQGIFHILPRLMSAIGLIILTYYLYGALL